MKMKNRLAILASATALLSSYTCAALAADEPTRMNWAFHTSYIPDGFDTNDNAQFVGEGIFPNTCYRPASPKVEINHDTKTIAVSPSAYHYNGICLQVLLPYSQVLDLGMLKTGTYTVVQAGAPADPTRTLGEIKIRTATNSSPDDYLYAPISQAFYQEKNGQGTITISGSFTNSCMSLTDVMVSIQPKVVVIQPISELTGTSDCKTGTFPFEKTVNVQGLKAGSRYLLHVRSLNGNSVNALFDAR